MATKNSAQEMDKTCQASDGSDSMTTTEYCRRLQQWMWRYYSGYVSWQSWVLMSTPLFPPPEFGCPTPGSTASTPADIASWYSHTNSGRPADTGTSGAADGGAAQPAGREYTIPSPMRRFLAETVDFFILFCVKATIVLWIMHLSGMKDISKFIMPFVMEEIDENTSLEDLQKMMVVPLAYRHLVCVYEIVCIWGAGGATPGKFLLGLRVVTCDSTVPVQPNRVLVVPASNVSLSASTLRAISKNFSIAFLFPIFVTLLFFQHNRAVYDVVAGTIVVRQRRAR